MNGIFFELMDALAKGRMPCHISDGPQTPDEMIKPEVDEDSVYERYRQYLIDRAREAE